MRTTGKSTNEKILGTARQRIASRGYRNFSHADVSTEVEIHKTSMHHHFPTKSALARATRNPAHFTHVTRAAYARVTGAPA